jgi:hypothetical protein
MKYVGVKIVEALPMTRGVYNNYAEREVPPIENHEDDGYLVRYEDGYESWCPKDTFERHNRLTTAMPFGYAIEAARQGHKIARLGWNGKGMFVVYMPPMHLPPFNSQEPGKKVNDRTAKFIGEEAPLDCQPYFAMYNAQKQWIPGWLASQSDMLSDDWFIVE